MAPTETSNLLPHSNDGKDDDTALTASSGLVSTLFLVFQVALLVFFYFGTEYTTEEYKVKE